MKLDQFIEKLTPHSGRAFLLGFGVAFAVLAATVISAAFYVRAVVRSQIAGRDAEALYATTLMEQLDAQAGVEGTLEDEDLGFEAALLASRLRGVMGIRFFDRQGRFRDSFPANIQPRDLDAQARRSLEEMRPSSRFVKLAPLDDVFIYLPQFSTGRVARASILEVVVPLHTRDGTNYVGAAEFILEGQSISTEYGRLDRNLTVIASLALVVAGLLLLGMLWPVFRRLEVAHTHLAEQGTRLLRANSELALAARTSALGAVSAHLVHGLKNPLASLSSYIHSQAAAEGKTPEREDSRDALSAARRMQALVEETLEVLSDVRGGPSYDVSAGEIVEAVAHRVAGRAKDKNVGVRTSVLTGLNLSSRTANLVRLVLSNLADNGMDATPGGGTVCLQCWQEGGSVLFGVRDEGPGFPDHLRPTLFLPCKSTREGGGGIGLAISHRIAEHLGATLELKESSKEGSFFVLRLPCAPTAASVEAVGAHRRS